MTVWVRAECSQAIGLGHVARQLATAEVGRDLGHRTCFVLDRSGLGADLVQDHGFLWRSAGAWEGDVSRGDVVVFDGYGLEAGSVDAVRARGAVAVWVDDRSLGSVGDRRADIVVNPNPPDIGAAVPPAHVLAGPTFAFVRSEFRRPPTPRRPGTDRILVAMGGTDATQRLERSVSVVLGVDAFATVVVLLGPGAGCEIASAFREPRVEVVRAPESMAALFSGVDAAVSAAGAMTWELLTAGVPTALLPLVDNQAGVARCVSDLDAALVVDTDEDAALADAVLRLADTGTQRLLHQRAVEAVDGLGARRVLEAALLVSATRTS